MNTRAHTHRWQDKQDGVLRRASIDGIVFKIPVNNDTSTIYYNKILIVKTKAAKKLRIKEYNLYTCCFLDCACITLVVLLIQTHRHCR